MTRRGGDHPSELDARVLALVGWPRAEISRRLGVTEHAVRSSLARLEARGEVARSGAGRGTARTVRATPPPTPTPSMPATLLRRLRELAGELRDATGDDDCRGATLAAALAAPGVETLLEGDDDDAGDDLLRRVARSAPPSAAPALAVLGAAFVDPRELARITWRLAGDDAAADVLLAAALELRAILRAAELSVAATGDRS